MKLSIIIPILNEEKTVEEIIRRVANAPLSIEKEIIVVNDGSTDSTADVLERMKEKHNLILEAHIKNQGKGSSIVTGLKMATGDFVIIQDADLEYDPKDYQKLLNPLISKQGEVVYGSRLLKENRKSSWAFYLGGKLVTAVTNILYNTKITDEPTCYKVFKKDLLNSLNLQSRGFEFCPEVTAKVAKRGIKILEVPISYNPRNSLQGKKIKWKDGIIAVWTLLKYKFIN